MVCTHTPNSDGLLRNATGAFAQKVMTLDAAASFVADGQSVGIGGSMMCFGME
jgi:hypothetical protein